MNTNYRGQKKLTIISAMMVSIYFITLQDVIPQVTISEQDWVIPTYLAAPAEKNPIFFNNEAHQGAARHVYPYAMNDTYLNEKTDKTYKALVLENEYIKLCVTPEIGGKLYYATDKTNGYNFI